jgi:NADP-dependent 3-hydroxy acid dehydrogenase YdfG
MGLDAFSLEDSVAVVPGGSRGTGERIAVSMAEVEADVAPVAHSEDALEATAERIEATGQSAAPYPLDVTDDAAIEAMFDDVEATLGEVDVLVNNAGTNPRFGNARKLDIETWQRTIEVNVGGVVALPD